MDQCFYFCGITIEMADPMSVLPRENEKCIDWLLITVQHLHGRADAEPNFIIRSETAVLGEKY